MTSPLSSPRRAALAVALAALLGGCTTPDAAALVNIHWSLSAIDGKPSTAPASLLLKDGHATGNTGCNPFSGSARISGSDIVFGPMISTKMACLPQARMEQEAALLAAFAVTAHWRLDQGALVLSDTQDKDRLRFTPP